MPATSVACAGRSAAVWDEVAAEERPMGSPPRSSVLTTADAERWRQVLPAHVNAIGSVEHLKLCERQTGYAARLFVVETPDPVVAYPFLLRPAQNLPFAGRDSDGKWDAFTPPYTGPLALRPWRGSHRFAELFERYCREQGVVAEFAHLHPWDVRAETLDSSC